jgi:hypothetical protein
MPLELNAKEFQDELDRMGLTRELFETILASSPSRQIIVGYPQETLDSMFIKQNW